MHCHLLCCSPNPNHFIAQQPQNKTMDTIWTTPAAAIVTPLTILIAYYVTFYSSRQSAQESTPSSSQQIPWAPGGIPILGHALLYKQDPPGFLTQTRNQVGNVFRLNLAGKEMIVVVGPNEQRVVAKAPESEYSARQAVANVGFLQLLGSLNVHTGADVHKGIVKGVWHSNPNQQVQMWLKSLEKSLSIEVEISTTATTDNKKYDLLPLLRRVFLRAVISHMISPDFLENWTFPFLQEYMEFQDILEEATAKAVVLPRWIALPAFLWPVQRRRHKLQQTIVKRLHELQKQQQDPSSMGYWWEDVKDHHSTDEIAELIVGLLFAAHKNPSIGAAQTFLMLHELTKSSDDNIFADCRNESKLFLSQPTWDCLQSKCPTLRHLCLESLRLTAHTLGAVRIAQSDLSLGDYIIPKGSTVSLAHMPTHRNEEYWNNPETMDLTRDIAKYNDDYHFTTFSHGTHKCPGQNTAIVMIQCTVALLLTKYNVTVPTKIPPLDFERATLAQRAGPVLVTIQPNSSSTLSS